jgi:hypothetical protein
VSVGWSIDGRGTKRRPATPNTTDAGQRREAQRGPGVSIGCVVFAHPRQSTHRCGRAGATRTRSGTPRACAAGGARASGRPRPAPETHPLDSSRCGRLARPGSPATCYSP